MGSRRKLLLPLLGAALVLAVLPLAGPTYAVQTITVDTTTDGAADCAPGHAAGTCTLRGAIAVANAEAGGGDTIQFAPTLSGTITLTTGELAINKNMTITGPGALTLAVSGNNASRVFNIGTTFTSTVGISGLTITNGRAPSPSSTIPGTGGAIQVLSPSTLTLSNATVTTS